MNIAENFRKRLKKEMYIQELTYHGLSMKTNIGDGTLVRYAHGENIPGLQNAHTIAKALGLTLDEMVGEEK